MVVCFASIGYCYGGDEIGEQVRKQRLLVCACVELRLSTAIIQLIFNLSIEKSRVLEISQDKNERIPFYFMWRCLRISGALIVNQFVTIPSTN